MELPSDSCTISNIDPVTPIKSNRESVTLIYFNPNIDINEHFEIIEKLRTLVDFVDWYDNVTACTSYVKSIAKEKVVIIIFSVVNVPQILSYVGHLRQVDSVLVLKNDGENNVVEHEKIVGFFTCLDDLLPTLRENVELIEKQLNTFNSFNQHQRSTRDLSAKPAEFLWFQLFKDIIMKMPHNDEAKRRMINLCRRYYRDNQKQMMLIDEFDRSYRSDEAIQWYTRPSFLYRLVNKALRTEDVEQLDTFRFFIHDLRVCLAREHNIIREFGGKLTFYRGATLSLSELETFTQNEKPLISTNGFLSTSRSRSVAEMFVDKSKVRTDVVPILFEIECDVDTLGNAVVLADVSYLSNVRDEDEVIFDLGVTFCIDAVVVPNDRASSNTTLIKMHATTDGHEIAREYINENRLNMTTTSVRVIFGKLLMDMGEYGQALHYFQQLIQEVDAEDLAWVHINLGSVYRILGLYLDAKAQYAIAYDLCAEEESPRYRDAASVIDNLGVIWDDMGNLDEALDCHKFAYKIRLTVLGPNHTDTGTSLINIGSVYYSKGHYEQALNCHLRALEINQESLPANHPDTAEVLSNIGITYLRICDYEGALEYFQQALIMQEKCLPTNHISTSNTLNNLGSVYYELGDYDRSLQYYSRSLKIKEACLLSNHKSFADCLDNIGNVYSIRKEYDQALKFKLQALKIRESILADDRPDTTISLLNISRTYFGKKDYDQAFDYAKKALAIQQRLKSIDSISIGDSLELLGDICRQQRDYAQSLEYHLKALEIREKCLPDVHQIIANNLYNIGILYEYLNNMKLALDYYINALRIYTECLPDEHPTRKMAQCRITRTKFFINRTDQKKVSRSASDQGKSIVINRNTSSSRRKSFG